MFFLPSSALVILRVFPNTKDIGQLRFIFPLPDNPLDFCHAALHVVFRLIFT